MRLKEFLKDGGLSSTAKNWDKISLGDKKRYIFEFLQKKGYSRNQSAALLGNLLQENGALNTKIVNGIGATGIAQWYKGRRDKLMTKENPYSIVTQLNYLDEELKSNGWANKIQHKNTFFGSDNIDDLTVAVRRGFERPGEHEANDKARLRYAYEILGNKFDGGVPSRDKSEYSEQVQEPQYSDMSEYNETLQNMSEGIYDYSKMNEMYQKNPKFTTMVFDNIDNKEKEYQRQQENERLNQERLNQEENKKMIEQENARIQGELDRKNQEREQILSMVPQAQSVSSGNI